MKVAKIGGFYWAHYSLSIQFYLKQKVSKSQLRSQVALFRCSIQWCPRFKICIPTGWTESTFRWVLYNTLIINRLDSQSLTNFFCLCLCLLPGLKRDKVVLPEILKLAFTVHHEWKTYRYEVHKFTGQRIIRYLDYNREILEIIFALWTGRFA